MSMLIPKKIHWCWLSGDPVPNHVNDCMDTWKKYCPGYEIRLWTREDFPPGKHWYVDNAIRRGKWAMACDFIRLYAVYTEGGIYLDSDVVLYAPLDKFLQYEFFSGIEYFKDAAERSRAGDLLGMYGELRDLRCRPFTRFIGIQAAVFGACKGNGYLKSCMEWYDHAPDICVEATYVGAIVMPFVMADVAYDFGFRYVNKLQYVNGLYIVPHDVFAGFNDQVTDQSIALHICMGSWRV